MTLRSRLMIVDDSLVMRNRIARLVAAPKLCDVQIVGLARDGVEALSVARDQKPDLITLDLTMPNLDGEACIGDLRKLLPAARILVVSALSHKLTAIRAVSRGAHGFLHKPFEDAALVRALYELRMLS
jgi:two-component system chemotaxis response regulator CheY